MRLLAPLLIILIMGSPVWADDPTAADEAAHRNVKIVSVAPIEHIGAGGTVTGVTMAAPDTLYSLVKYVPVGLDGTPKVILADAQGQQYRIDLKATDYTPPPAQPEAAVVITPPAVIPATNAPPPTPTPAPTASPTAVAAPENIARSPGAYSLHAPPGWRIKTTNTGGLIICDLVGTNDCVAMISSWSTPRDGSLRKFAEWQLGFEQRALPGADCQISDLQPYTTASGWEGLMFTKTITYKGNTNVQAHYFFSGRDDSKIIFSTTCHGESADHYTPLFNDAIKSIVRE